MNRFLRARRREVKARRSWRSLRSLNSRNSWTSARACGTQLAQQVQDLHVLRLSGCCSCGLGRPAVAEEIGEIEIEDAEDLEQFVEGDPVLALLHPREIGLLDANLARQLGLRQAALLAQLPQAAADGGHFGRLQSAFSGPSDLAFLSDL